jgi:hypothetical protein
LSLSVLRILVVIFTTKIWRTLRDTKAFFIVINDYFYLLNMLHFGFTAVAELSQIAVADKDSDSCLKLRLRIAPSLAFLLAPQVSNHQILKTISCYQSTYYQ